jgi:hypothetical protein
MACLMVVLLALGYKGRKTRQFRLLTVWLGGYNEMLWHHSVSMRRVGWLRLLCINRTLLLLFRWWRSFALGQQLSSLLFGKLKMGRFYYNLSLILFLVSFSQLFVKCSSDDYLRSSSLPSWRVIHSSCSKVVGDFVILNLLFPRINWSWRLNLT